MAAQRRVAADTIPALAGCNALHHWAPLGIDTHPNGSPSGRTGWRGTSQTERTKSRTETELGCRIRTAVIYSRYNSPSPPSARQERFPGESGLTRGSVTLSVSPGQLFGDFLSVQKVTLRSTLPILGKDWMAMRTLLPALSSVLPFALSGTARLLKGRIRTSMSHSVAAYPPHRLTTEKT